MSSFDEYLEMVEDAAEDGPRLGELMAEITGSADVGDEERAELLGRIGTYRGDIAGQQDPSQQAEYGQGPTLDTPPDDFLDLGGWDDTDPDVDDDVA